MTQPGRIAAPRRGSRNPAQLVLGVLVALAVGGSLLMVFSDSAQLLRLAVVALLWVAVICSIAVTKYRKEAATSASRAQELQKVYELELEREVTARREHELVVERELQDRMSAQQQADSIDELADLRAEVQALRESLTALFNGELVVERVAVRAESTRVRALTDRSRQAASGNRELDPAESSVVEEDGVVDVDVETEEQVDDAADANEVEAEPDEVAQSDEETEPGAHSAGRSVADLIAAYGGSVDASRRRRRSTD